MIIIDVFFRKQIVEKETNGESKALCTTLNDLLSFDFYFVKIGVTGFEPTTSWPQRIPNTFLSLFHESGYAYNF